MGPEMMQLFFKQAMRFSTRVVTDDGIKSGKDIAAGLYTPFQNVESVDLSRRPFAVKGEGGLEVEAHALIIATGAKANWLGQENVSRLALMIPPDLPQLYKPLFQ